MSGFIYALQFGTQPISSINFNPATGNAIGVLGGVSKNLGVRGISLAPFGLNTFVNSQMKSSTYFKSDFLGIGTNYKRVAYAYEGKEYVFNIGLKSDTKQFLDRLNARYQFGDAVRNEITGVIDLVLDGKDSNKSKGEKVKVIIDLVIEYGGKVLKILSDTGVIKDKNAVQFDPSVLGVDPNTGLPLRATNTGNTSTQTAGGAGGAGGSNNTNTLLLGLVAAGVVLYVASKD